MMSWEIVAGIIALVGFVGTIATWSGKLSRTLASLETTLNALRNTLEELKENNRESHKEIYRRLDEHEHWITRIKDKLGLN